MASPINMPSAGFRAARFGLKTNTGLFQSSLNRYVQRIERAGAIWQATFEYPPMKREDAAAVVAFLVKLSGVANTFYGYDPAATTPQGTGNGTPLVNGADQTGSALVTDGWDASETVLKAGDYFSVNDEFKMVTDDVTSDGSGNATINFKPQLRSSPADNAAMTVSAPKCIMALVDDDQAIWDVNEASFYGIQFMAREVFST